MIVNKKINKTGHIVKSQARMDRQIRALEREFPSFMKDYSIFLRGSVALSTHNAYFKDIKFFFEYLIEDTNFTNANKLSEITLSDLESLRARDINYFLGDYCRRYYKEDEDGRVQVFENSNRSLSRKKSSLTSLFQFLFRNEQLSEDITTGFNPIKLPKKDPDSIKRLYEDEIRSLLHAVTTGNGLTDRERIYWEKTKLRDRAIILLFLTYGLRLKELANLDIDSFNFKRMEFTIFRKRDKESVMPINQTIYNALTEYIDTERPSFTTEDALFLSLQGKRITERAIRELVKKYTSIAMQTSRREGYSPHKLRATAASTLIERGYSIFDVQELLDHDNVTTTQLYAAHRKGAKEQIIQEFDEE